jgi:hypothetical protein
MRICYGKDKILSELQVVSAMLRNYGCLVMFLENVGVFGFFYVFGGGWGWCVFSVEIGIVMWGLQFCVKSAICGLQFCDEVVTLVKVLLSYCEYDVIQDMVTVVLRYLCTAI